VRLRRFGSATARGVAYQTSGTVSFRDTAGTGLHLVSLELELVDAQGRTSHQRSPVDLRLAPGATATVPLPDTLYAPVGLESVRLVVSAIGVDEAGQRLSVPSSEAPVVVVQPDAATPGQAVTFVGAGDIANCDLAGASATAQLLQGIQGEVFTLGDHVYPNGTAESFATCYESTWGRHRSRTHPTPGNHDWDVSRGAPYLAYFGAAAGPGYYSFNLGAWHVLSLNSNINAQPGSSQFEWVRADLAANASPCTLAYWHHPLFSSGSNGNNPQMRAIWQLLDEAGVEFVMSGHDHLYERFAPQDANGRATPAGVRAFTVGTGGTSLYGATSIQPNSDVRDNQSWGVLKLTLRSGSYDWEFVPVAGHSFRDLGSAPCS
jgi:hypothetical protein